MGYSPIKKGRGPYTLYVAKPELEQKYVVENLNRWQCAEYFGISKGTLENLLKFHRVAKDHRPGRLRPGKKPKTEPKALICTDDEFREMRQTMTNREIAAKFGASISAVSARNRRLGIMLSSSETNLRGGRYRRSLMLPEKVCKSSGYRYIFAPENHRAFTGQLGSYVEEHRLIVEVHIGRPLHAEEIVHHINMVKTDNRIENLAVMNCSVHRSVHSYYELVAVYLAGLREERPAPFRFSQLTWWGGEQVMEIDLCKGITTNAV